MITLHVRKVGWWTGQLYDRVHNLERAKDRFEHVNEAFKHHLKIRMTGNLIRTCHEISLSFDFFYPSIDR